MSVIREDNFAEAKGRQPKFVFSKDTVEDSE